MARTSSDQAGPADTATAAASVLRLTDIRVRLGSTIALDGVSLEVGPGQVVGVVGGAGAGKSTVFNAVCGFVRPEAGAITWRGVPLRPRPYRLATLGVGRTLQGVGLYGGLTVLENVLVGSAGVPRVPAVPPGRPAGIAVALLGTVRPAHDGQARRVLAVDHLTRLGLAGYLDADLAAVPAALRGRVVLARALLAEPELLLLDDPAVGLDPVAGPESALGPRSAAIAELVTLLRALPARSAQAGRTCAVLLGTRVPELALAASDQVVLLDRGAVTGAGTPAELRARSAVPASFRPAGGL